VKGSFSGAVATKQRLFEDAHPATLFLDEDSNIILETQGKLLRVLETKHFERVGDHRPIGVDVRIITATNKDLQEMIESKRFREDLFFRLNVIPIHIPPLRERTEDIPELLNYFLKSFGSGDIKISPSAMDYIQRYSWPGNVRELKNFAERLSILCETDRIEQDVVENILGMVSNTSSGKIPLKSEAIKGGNKFGLPEDILALDYNEAKDLFEKRYLEYKLSENGYIISRTAELIGMYPSNLHAKIKKHGIRMER
jgi:two-component system nitrogen regulation response regulator NtrX